MAKQITQSYTLAEAEAAAEAAPGSTICEFYQNNRATGCYAILVENHATFSLVEVSPGDVRRWTNKELRFLIAQA